MVPKQNKHKKTKPNYVFVLDFYNYYIRNHCIHILQA